MIEITQKTFGSPKGGRRTPQPSKKITAPKKQETGDRLYYCSSCGKSFNKLKGNFHVSHSAFYKALGYLPVCMKCISHFIEQYKDKFGNENDAIRRMALHFDLYLDESLLNASRKINATQSRFSGYISKINMQQYRREKESIDEDDEWKTYDDYLDELAEQDRLDTKIESVDDLAAVQQTHEHITPELVAFWGYGLPPEDYLYLEEKFKDWTSRQECKTKAQESLFQKICMVELQINKAIRDDGSKLDSLMRAYNSLLDAANIQPKQTRDNALADQNTFGTLIQKWENERPIPEPEPEWEDVDNIRKYINVYFLGHLCKMAGLNNKYSAEYEAEISKYTVEKPEYFEEDDTSLDDIFGADDEGDD